MSGITYAQIQAQTKWLVEHPDFSERPASIDEFLDEDYLNISSGIRDGVRESLKEIFDTPPEEERIAKYERAIVSGAIGVGKTTFASIALAYMCHWVLCLRNPQEYFGLLPGSKIAFMMMSTSESQAREVIFGDTKARVDNSVWFREKYPYDPKFKRQVRFDQKEIWILPGDSAETSFEGYNILGGILDEADSHKVTKEKDSAQEGLNTIESRVASRFVDNSDPNREGHRGIIIVIGQMKKANGFAAKTYKQFKEDPRSYAFKMTIWESFGWEKYTDKVTGKRNSFWYDIKRKMIIPPGVGAILNDETVIEIPKAFAHQFKNNPEKALRDLAGIPPTVSDAFISLIHKVEYARDKWKDRTGYASPVDMSCINPKFASWFKSVNDPRRRALHVDLSYSADGDALGMAMGYIDHLVRIDDEEKPYIVIDFLLRMRASPGTEIILGDVRKIIYSLRDDLHFKLKKVTYDGFQSTDTLQQLRKKKFEAENISVDKSMLPYEDLREAIYEERIEFPQYLTFLNLGDITPIEIAVKELSELSTSSNKVDHPPKGSKDVADCLAGVCCSLMGDRNFRRGLSLSKLPSQQLSSVDHQLELLSKDFAIDTSNLQGMNSSSSRQGGVGSLSTRAPVPPRFPQGGLGLDIPSRLQSKRGK